MEDIGDDDEEELADRQVPRLRKLYKPTRTEIEEHMVMHMPFRSWCPHCVRGRAQTGLHQLRTCDRPEDSVPVVAVDYMYMASGDDDNDDAANMVVCPYG